mmetsp:Transcript_2720/g.5670  ORF Transcript_2720/g.5670 Transcript_2720/m.5670 type:complete len:81 (-) Transcript_2720:22-264(-)
MSVPPGVPEPTAGAQSAVHGAAACELRETRSVFGPGEVEGEDWERALMFSRLLPWFLRSHSEQKRFTVAYILQLMNETNA